MLLFGFALEVGFHTGESRMVREVIGDPTYGTLGGSTDFFSVLIDFSP